MLTYQQRLRKELRVSGSLVDSGGFRGQVLEARSESQGAPTLPAAARLWAQPERSYPDSYPTAPGYQTL